MSTAARKARKRENRWLRARTTAPDLLRDIVNSEWADRRAKTATPVAERIENQPFLHDVRGQLVFRRSAAARRRLALHTPEKEAA